MVFHKGLKRILITSSSNSVILIDYIRELLSVGKFEITVIGCHQSTWLEFYRQHGVKFFYIPEENAPEKFFPRKIRRPGDFLHWLRARLFILINKGRYDFVHVQSMVGSALKYAAIMNAHKGKLILTDWGRVYVKNHKEFMQEKCYLDEAYKIVVMNEDAKDVINREYDFLFDKKCIVLDFGNTTIKYMDYYMSRYGNKRLKEMARKHYGMPQDKIVIAIGYCGRKQQQHIYVINQINTFPESVKKKIFLYCQMSYSVTDVSYVKRVRRALEICGCQYVIDKQFLKYPQNAAMKMGVDIFVHAGKIDALSASMMEYIYAGKKVFNPAWVGYNLYDECGGVRDITYSDFEDLRDKLLEAIRNPYWDSETQETNRRIIGELKSWENLLPKWVELYE